MRPTDIRGILGYLGVYTDISRLYQPALHTILFEKLLPFNNEQKKSIQTYSHKILFTCS